MPREVLSEAFTRKKNNILKSLAQSQETYTDKSPKGSIDAPIIDLIAEINGIDGLVTTSSCSGRVAVFVEGVQSPFHEPAAINGDDDIARTTDVNGSRGLSGEVVGVGGVGDGSEGDGVGDGIDQKPVIKTGPGGKGGGRWLYVSHDPVPFDNTHGSDQTVLGDDNFFTRLCGLDNYHQHHDLKTSSQARMQSRSQSRPQPDVASAAHDTQTGRSTATQSTPRLIKLSFSPLILHVLTADLNRHARPLLAAAINAGFRESGVQSLAALESTSSSKSKPPSTSSSSSRPNTDASASTSSGTGTMLAIRTAGISFETVIGQVVTTSTPNNNNQSQSECVEIMQSLVSESYLRMCFEVINSRFEWNQTRKERLRTEIAKAFARVESNLAWESKEDRRIRKREEGLKRQAQNAQKEEQSILKQVDDGADQADSLVDRHISEGDELDQLGIAELDL